MGTIYQRGNVYWIKYYRDGKPYRESSKSEDEGKAIDLLKLREGEIVMGLFPGLRVQKVMFDELAQDYLNDYKINARKSLERAEMSLKHLKAFFGRCKAIAITTSR
ncbi:MAG: site-specific integrase, partial [Deltaproteobacteria bacterium]|nr:site-specific integrase [Deltaproteobacteria bacterium]